MRFNLQRHLVSRSTLRKFRAEAIEAMADRNIDHVIGTLSKLRRLRPDCRDGVDGPCYGIDVPR